MGDNLRIHASLDRDTRLIPLSIHAPQALPPPLNEFPIIITPGIVEDRKRPSWLQLLRDMIGEPLVDKHRKSWPSSHELVGDMMILKIEESVREFQPQIIRSKMAANRNIRLVLEDRGVKGKYRVRDLRPVGIRENGKIAPVPIGSEYPTKVIVKESGHMIVCDPASAYYSTRLQTERISTAFEARRLSETIGTKINVADPFCGVGPALAHLVNIPGLVSSILASDLNPMAIKLLHENLSRWIGMPSDTEVTGITEWKKGVWSGVADAREILKMDLPIGFWNLLIMNLPHKFIDFLPLVLPLLDSSKPYVVRGRLVCGNEEIEDIRSLISQYFPDGSDVVVDPRSEYSPNTKLCSVTIRSFASAE